MQGHSVIRLDVSSSFERAVRDVIDEIARARGRGDADLLIIAGEIQFAPPTISARHDMARRWAAAADGDLTIAVVCPAEFIDPEKFGVVSARNFGLNANVFATESEAAEWLREQRDARARARLANR